jgi:hypothetical protein
MRRVSLLACVAGVVLPDTSRYHMPTVRPDTSPYHMPIVGPKPRR